MSDAKPTVEISESHAADQCEGNLAGQAWSAAVSASRDAWRAMSSATTDVLHELKLTDAQGDYSLGKFAKDHPQAVELLTDVAVLTGVTLAVAPTTVAGGIVTGLAAYEGAEALQGAFRKPTSWHDYAEAVSSAAIYGVLGGRAFQRTESDAKDQTPQRLEK